MKMPISEYRNNTKHLNQIGIDYHACANASERAMWRKRAIWALRSYKKDTARTKAIDVNSRQKALSALDRLLNGL